ncbi:hypothetical protein ACQEVU_58390 [Dactylosporangium sp. CA-139066]
MIRSTAMTAGAALFMAVAAAGFAWSIAGLDGGRHATWIGGATIAGFAAAGSVYLIGRAHEAARTERRSP